MNMVAEKAKYLYIKKIKKNILCPACREKMYYNKSRRKWICKSCGFTVNKYTHELYYRGWYCIECGDFLNRQEGFDREKGKHTCAVCSRENDISYETSKILCSMCGISIDSEDTLELCSDCREEIKGQAKNIAMIAGSALMAWALKQLLDHLNGNSSEQESSITQCEDSNNEKIDEEKEDNVTQTEKQDRYVVEMKAFKTGEWYVKTTTNSKASAYSVAYFNNYGRAYRIIDAETGEILLENDEDESMKESNGYPNGRPW